MQVFQISNFLGLKRRPVFSFSEDQFSSPCLEGLVDVSLLYSNVIGKGDGHGGRQHQQWTRCDDVCLSAMIDDTEVFHPPNTENPTIQPIQRRSL